MGDRRVIHTMRCWSDGMCELLDETAECERLRLELEREKRAHADTLQRLRDYQDEVDDE